MTPKPLKIAEIIFLVAVVVGGVWLVIKKPAHMVQPSPKQTSTPTSEPALQIYPGTNYQYVTYPNPQRLTPEEFLKQNYQVWLGTPSQYTDFVINVGLTRLHT